MKTNTLLLASILTLSATTALAEQAIEPQTAPMPQAEILTNEQPTAPSIFEKLDANKDGKVSPQEAQVSPALVKGFEHIDTNKDGFLSTDEFSQLQVNATPAPTYIALAGLHTL